MLCYRQLKKSNTIDIQTFKAIASLPSIFTTVSTKSSHMMTIMLPFAK